MKNKIIYVSVLASILLAGIFYRPVLTEAAVINDVTAQVTSQQPLPLVVKNRMEKSVATIAQQLLVDKTTDKIQSERLEYKEIISKVFDKVLVGYNVRSVELSLAETSKVTVELEPWEDKIKQVTVNVQVDGMPPLIEEMAKVDMAGVEIIFSDSLNGLPLAATDWAYGAIRESLNRYMADNLPEFRADFTLDPQENATVQLTVYPLLPVVRTVDLKMRSDTFPSITLLSVRHKMQLETHQLLGVPVAFVARHQEQLEQHYADMLDNLDSFRYFRAHTRVFIKPDQAMELMSRSDTERLRVRGESWTEIGNYPKKDQESRFRGILGYMLTPRDEIYFLGELFSRDDWSWQSHIGYTHEIIPKVWFGLQHNFQYGEMETELGWQIDHRWSIHHEYRRWDNDNEWSVRYRMHDFLALEGVHDKTANWLRLIGSF